MKMKPPENHHLPAIETLLRESGLPTDDLALQDLSLFLIYARDGQLNAVGGLERCGKRALIRSVATATDWRGRGLAQRVVRELEQLARDSGFIELYLLTETAERFFERLDYEVCDRSKVPQPVRECRQFSSLCPDTATVMCKRLIA